MLDGVNGVNKAGVNPEQTPVKENDSKDKANSIFSNWDKDSDGKITAEETGIKEILKDFEALPNQVRTDKGAKALSEIKNAIRNLLSEINYKKEGASSFDDLTKEVEKRKTDAENIARLANDIKAGRLDVAAANFEKLKLTSQAAIDAVDIDHNDNVKKAKAHDVAKGALEQLAEAAVLSAGKVSAGDINTKLVDGLKFGEVRVVPVNDHDDKGSANDYRLSTGEKFVKADALKIVLEYTYKGESFKIDKKIPTPPGYEAEGRVKGEAITVTFEDEPEDNYPDY